MNIYWFYTILYRNFDQFGIQLPFWMVHFDDLIISHYSSWPWTMSLQDKLWLFNRTRAIPVAIYYQFLE